MKKFLSLFMAMAIASSLFAMPQVKAGQTATRAKKATTEQSALPKFVVEAAKRDLSKREKPQMTEATDNGILRRMQARTEAADTTYLVTEGFSVEPSYDEELGSWYFAAIFGDYYFRFDFQAPADDYCGSYTIEAFDLYNSYGMDDYGDWIDYQDVKMTITKENVSTYLTKIVVNAIIVSTYGDIYALTINHSVFVPKSTMEHSISNATVNLTGWEVVLAGKNAELDVNVTINNGWPIGRYTQGDLNMDFTKILYNNVEQTIMQPEIIINTGKLEDGSLSYIANVNYFDQDTTLHKVTLYAPLPENTNPIKASFVNMEVDDSWAAYNGLVNVVASNDLYSVDVSYAADVLMEGTYDIYYMSVSNNETYDFYETIYGQITISHDEVEGWKAHIEAFCSDNNWYQFDMKFEVPVPTDTVTVRFETSAKAAFYPNMDNDLQLYNIDDYWEASIDIYGVEMGGAFSNGNLDDMYTFLYDAEFNEIKIADVKGTINQYGDTTVINAEIISFDAILYQVELWYAVAPTTETVEYSLPVTFVNNLDNGYYSLQGYGPDSAFYISLSPMTNEIAGEFANDGKFGGFGAEGGKHDFESNETYLYVYDVENFDPYMYDEYRVQKGTLKVDLAENGKTITAVASLNVGNGILYNLTMTSEYNKHLDYDSDCCPVDRTYTDADLVSVQDASEDGYIYLALTAADLTDAAALVFYVEAADPDIVIPAGTYTIDSSEDYGTVHANPGASALGVFPSYYAALNEEGYLTTPLYLLVGGTVEVSKNDAGKLHVEVNALNSYDIPVHIVYDATGTGLENIEVENIIDAQKMIIDGQLVIIRNGKAYNANGAQLQ